MPSYFDYGYRILNMCGDGHVGQAGSICSSWSRRPRVSIFGETCI